MRVLLIRFSSIGDIVLTTPIARSLVQARPDVELHVLTKPAFADLYRYNPWVKEVHTWAPPISGVLSKLRALRFTHILDLHQNLRSLRVRLALPEASASTFPKLNLEKWRLTRLKQDVLPRVHIVERYAQALQAFEVALDHQGLEIHWPPEADQEADQVLLPVSWKEAPIGVVLGAKHATKQYPADLYAELLNQLNEPVVLLGGPADRAMAKRVKAQLSVPFADAVGRLSLLSSAALIQRCRAVITPDTGLMHLAAACQKPVFSIWGNTVPAFGMEPYRTPHRIFQVKGLACRPCSKIGYSKCPLGHFACMRQQEPSALAQAIQADLAALSQMPADVQLSVW